MHPKKHAHRISRTQHLLPSSLIEEQQISQYALTESNHQKQLGRHQYANKSAVLTHKQLNRNFQMPNYILSSKNNGLKSSAAIHNITILKKQSKGHQVSHSLLRPLKQGTSTNHRGISLISQYPKSSQQVQPIMNKFYTRFPDRIIGILYQQGIKNYNPYLAALNQLQKYDTQPQNYDKQQLNPNLIHSKQPPTKKHTISIQNKRQLQKLCYIGLAKNYFRNKKFTQMPQYGRTGILIRTYMTEVVKSILQEQKGIKHKNKEDVIIINCNATALSFNPYIRPKELENHVTRKKYKEIIGGVNRIIAGEYRKYKLSNGSMMKKSLTYSEIIMYILILAVIALTAVWTPSYYSNQGKGALAIIFGTIIAGMAFASFECSRNLSKTHESKNTITNTQKKMQNHLQKVSDDSLTWKVGQDFYWLEVHNNKVQKRKVCLNSEDF